MSSNGVTYPIFTDSDPSYLKEFFVITTDNDIFRVFIEMNEMGTQWLPTMENIGSHGKLFDRARIRLQSGYYVAVTALAVFLYGDDDLLKKKLSDQDLRRHIFSLYPDIDETERTGLVAVLSVDKYRSVEISREKNLRLADRAFLETETKTVLQYLNGSHPVFKVSQNNNLRFWVNVPIAH